MPDQILDDDDLDLSPEVLCLRIRRRSRDSALSDATPAPSPREDTGPTGAGRRGP
jgi:hypothetical protein